MTASNLPLQLAQRTMAVSKSGTQKPLSHKLYKSSMLFILNIIMF